MKHKKAITSVAFLLLGLGGLQAQKIATTAGGEATGTGGTTSYSVGQVVYTTATGTNGSITQGVQQSYEISTTLDISKATISLEMNVFPNPTTNFLYLKLSSEKTENLSYQLYDVLGKVIESKKINDYSTTIKIETLPKATYFLKVTNNQNIVKTFKVIKN